MHSPYGSRFQVIIIIISLLLLSFPFFCLFIILLALVIIIMLGVWCPQRILEKETIEADCGNSTSNVAQAVAEWTAKRVYLNRVVDTAYFADDFPKSIGTPLPLIE